eukprot:TRINITY_DN16098_c0_g1_i2.p1 TRINITY_DN16098_c0_g1~~TRINITY_DN16098_c0_g1_i2.p1  ORF type:complete len:296 (-),score=40.26 TRINITY_DN16098_c0_g1_i2:222-1109(-)
MAEGGGGLGSEQRHNRYHAESEEDPSRQPLTARQDSQLDAHPSGAQQLGPWTTRLLRAITRRGDFNSPLPQGAVWQLSWLQLLIPLCAVVFLVGVFFQVWCAIDGLIVLKKEHNVPTQCSALRFWALGYCMVVLCAPCAPGCLGLPVVMAALYILAGRVVRARVTGECEEQVPLLWAFVDECGRRGLPSLECAVIVALLGRFIEGRILRMQATLGGDGPTLEEVVSRILATPPPSSVPPGTECAVCLGEGSLVDTWRVLRCGHMFHEECLVEWLKRGRRCPLCRLDLHQAYSAEE